MNALLRPRWLWLNALAMAFSLAHLIMDWHIGLFGASSEEISGAQAALVWLVGFVYAWWGVSVVAAARGLRAGLLGLVALNGGWVFLGNGAPIAACPPPCAGAFPHQDIAHVGSLLFGGWAAYESWRATRESPQPLGRTGWAIPVVAVGAVIALFSLEASLTSR